MRGHREEPERRRRQQSYYDDIPEDSPRGYGPPAHSSSYDSGRHLYRESEERANRRSKGRRSSNGAHSEFHMQSAPIAAAPRPSRASHFRQERSFGYEEDLEPKASTRRRHSMRDELHPRPRASGRVVEAPQLPDDLSEESDETSSEDDDEDDDEDEETSDDDDESSDDSDLSDKSEADDEASLRKSRKALETSPETSEGDDDDDDYDDEDDDEIRAPVGGGKRYPLPENTDDDDSPSPRPRRKQRASRRQIKNAGEDPSNPKAIEGPSPRRRRNTASPPRVPSSRASAAAAADLRSEISPKKSAKKRDAARQEPRQEARHEGHRRAKLSKSSLGSLHSSNRQSSVMLSSASQPMTPDSRREKPRKRDKHKAEKVRKKHSDSREVHHEHDKPSRRPRRRVHEEDGYAHHAPEEEELPRGFMDMTLHEEPSDMEDDDEVAGHGMELGLGIAPAASRHKKDPHKKRSKAKHRTQPPSSKQSLPPAPEPPRRKSIDVFDREGTFQRADTFPSPQSKSYDRESYVTEVHRARGSRGGSMERRLADRFGMPSRAEMPGRPDMPHVAPPMASPMMMPGGGPPHPQMGGPPFGGPSMGMPMRAPPSGVPPMMIPTMGPQPVYNNAYGHSFGPVPGSAREHMHAHEHDPRRRHDYENVPRSSMAGLDGNGAGMDRVGEWLNFVPDEVVRT